MVVALALVLLTGLDIAASLAAKEAVARRSPLIAVVGAVLFVGMFYVLASVLARNADLAVITFGWSVLVQVGVLLLDRFRYGVHFTSGQWVAVALALTAQMYLLWPAQPSTANSHEAQGLSRAISDPVSPGTHTVPASANHASAGAVTPELSSRGSSTPVTSR